MPAPELGEETSAATQGLAVELPAVFLLALPGATLRKADGVTELVAPGSVISASGWVPLGDGLVAANLGERGKWTLLVTEWAVYKRG